MRIRDHFLHTLAFPCCSNPSDSPSVSRLAKASSAAELNLHKFLIIKILMITYLFISL